MKRSRLKRKGSKARKARMRTVFVAIDNETNDVRAVISAKNLSDAKKVLAGEYDLSPSELKEEVHFKMMAVL